MITVILRGVVGRKLRAVLTAIAIVLGVAMISGTYVLMDTTMRAFDQVFETAYSKRTPPYSARRRSALQRPSRRPCPRRWSSRSAACRK